MSNPSEASCPKSMTYGPCGGVEPDGRCEVAPDPCVFLDHPTISWHGIGSAVGSGLIARPVTADPAGAVVPSTRADTMRAKLGVRPIVIADLPARALDPESITEIGAVLSDLDAVLAGDHGAARLQFPPAYRAMLLREAGLEVWAGVNCRDRNRVAIESELAALAHAGAAGVHCVTGDHTLVGSRPDAAPVFDLDSTEVAAIASSYGHCVSVAESPAAAPRERRAERLAQKVAAGAEVCFVDHCGGADQVRAFATELDHLGIAIPLIACVPMIVSSASADTLLNFPSIAMPPGYVHQVLAAADPLSAGVTAAIELSEEMLDISNVLGVNLSGGADSDRLRFADAMATVADALR